MFLSDEFNLFWKNPAILFRMGDFLRGKNDTDLFFDHPVDKYVGGPNGFMGLFSNPRATVPTRISEHNEPRDIYSCLMTTQKMKILQKKYLQTFWVLESKMENF